MNDRFRYLASGGNDNQLHFWPQQVSGRVRPVHTFNDHMAGIKAISWCPFQKGSLIFCAPVLILLS